MDKTLLKGLKVLEAVTDTENPPRSIDDLAARVGLGRSNAHRTLQTLVYAGYIVKDEEAGRYRGTLRLFELGARQLAQLDVRKVAAPYMRTLADATHETVHLSVLDGMEVIYVDKIDSPKPIRAYSMIGGRAPAYAVATGKALLANKSSEYLDSNLAHLQAFTSTTVASLPLLKEELSKVSRQGFAINRGEWRENVGGFAAAIFDSSDRPIAAVGISGPLDRFVAARTNEFGSVVMACAHDISAAMGHRGRAKADR